MRPNRRLRFMTDPNPDGTPGAPPAGTPAVKTFTQEELNAIAAREKDQGRVAALREASEKLGGLSIDDAAKLVEAARAADEANKTEAQRALDAANAEKAEAAKIKADAAADRHAARLERLLGKAGAVDVEIAARALDVALGADEAAVTAAIDALKAKVPGLFGTATPPPDTDPGKQPPPGGGAKTTVADQAAAVAKARGWVS